MPRGHRLDHGQTERLGEGDRVQQGERRPEDRGPLLRTDRPEVDDPVAVDLRLDLVAK